MEPVGRESAYNPCYLDRSTTGSLLSFCDSLSYTVYQYEHNYGVSPVRRAPKVEYHLVVASVRSTAGARRSSSGKRAF